MAYSKRIYIDNVEEIKKSPCTKYELENKVILNKYFEENQSTTYTRGDIIISNKDPYINNNCYIFNGVNLDMLEFDDQYNMYGYVPDNYDAIADFSLHYWKNSIKNNTFVRVKLSPYRYSIIEQLKICNLFKLETSFDINDKPSTTPVSKKYNYIRTKLRIPVKGIPKKYGYDFFDMYIILSTAELHYETDNELRDLIIAIFKNYLNRQDKKNIKCNIVSNELIGYEIFWKDIVSKKQLYMDNYICLEILDGMVSMENIQNNIAPVNPVVQIAPVNPDEQIVQVENEQVVSDERVESNEQAGYEKVESKQVESDEQAKPEQVEFDEQAEPEQVESHKQEEHEQAEHEQADPNEKVEQEEPDEKVVQVKPDEQVEQANPNEQVLSVEFDKTYLSGFTDSTCLSEKIE